MITDKEAIEINHRFYELKQSCKNCSEEDLTRLDRAFNYAREFYGESRKSSGELKMLHSLKVTLIVASEIGLRTGSVIAALLHDVIDSPDENIDTVEQMFGGDIAMIIRGFKKISRFHSEKVSFQSENFRSLFLSMVDDVRVIFIKMAHRLHDMRNYENLPPHLRKAFLNDAVYLYIPIAHRLGLYQIKADLEDLVLRHSQPTAYLQISSKLRETREQQEKYIKRFIKPVVGRLKDEGIRFEIKSRAKTITSIKKKMDTQEVPLEQVYDLFAIRIILKNILTEEEQEFMEDFKRNLDAYGNPRLEKRGRKLKEKQVPKGSRNSRKGEVITEAAIVEEEQDKKAEVRNFEKNKEKYTEFLNREKTACWQIYSLITNIYQPNPKRLRDWISAPKASGYESLHTTVLGPDERWVEVQIRTQRMDEEAEKGSAAHWRYKESAYGRNVDRWMNDIRDVLEKRGAGRLDDGKTSKIETGSNNIYVFTPTGDLRELKAGSTILDFAFEIHTEVGAKCIGGKIENKVYPIRHKLKNGDRVEIITAKNQKPNIDWLNIVVTSKAKSRINRSLREEKYKEAELGKDILNRKLKNWKIEASERNINRAVKHYGFQKPVDLYYHIATGKVDVQEIKLLFTTPEEFEDHIEKQERPFEFTEQHIETQSEKDQGFIMIEAGMSDLEYSLAKCCNPIAGDRIFGFVTVNQGIKIHRYDCPNAEQMLMRYPYRIMKARWKETDTTKFFITNLRVLGLDRVGLVSDITKVISDDLKVNMKNLNFSSRDSHFEGVIKVQVRDVEHLGFLKQKLLRINGVTKVIRFD
ncbi:MAG: RelA/SpoT family protein [Bacteroidales bacterium]